MPYAVALALVLLLHLFFLFSGMTPVRDGLLPAPDSYMRLLRGTHLYETGAWSDGTLPRSNWPCGGSQNWTRPAAVLRLSGALALKPLLGFDRALFWWGSVTAPLLHMAAALALFWATAPLLAASRRLLVVLALLVQIPIWLHGIFGRTDHHMFIILVLGGTVRMMARPAGPHVRLLAGAVAGLGMWLSLEFLVFLAAIFGALTLAWIRSGENRARDNIWQAGGLTLVILLAVLSARAGGLAGRSARPHFDRPSAGSRVGDPILDGGSFHRAPPDGGGHARQAIDDRRPRGLGRCDPRRLPQVLPRAVRRLQLGGLQSRLPRNSSRLCQRIWRALGVSCWISGQRSWRCLVSASRFCAHGERVSGTAGCWWSWGCWPICP